MGSGSKSVDLATLFLETPLRNYRTAMILRHYTSHYAADLILESATIRATPGPIGYGVNSGPFFFVEGMREQERPTGLNHNEVVLHFE